MSRERKSKCFGKTNSDRCQQKGNRRRSRQRKQVHRARRRRVQTRYARQLREGLQWLLKPLAEKLPGVHGNAVWTLPVTIAQTLLWLLSEKRKSTDAFESAKKQCQRLYGEVAFDSYNGLMKTLVRYQDQLLDVVLQPLREKVQSLLGSEFVTAGWVLFGVDGSRDLASRTEANERALHSATYGRGQTAKYRPKKTQGKRRKAIQAKPPTPPAPQVWMTNIQHVRSGISWVWKVGPGYASERQHAQEMLKDTQFPLKSLFIGDAGFVGYAIWEAILATGHHFVIRVGANVNLLEELVIEPSSSGEKGIVYCWPKSHRRKSPPLKLRLIEITLGGEKATLLTSVLDPADLNDEDALTIYKSRWSVELGFRELKQTFERRVLRSRRPDRALAELSFSLLACSIVRVLGLNSHRNKRQRVPKAKISRISFASVLRTVRTVLEDLLDVDVQRDSFETQLRQCLLDDYERKKSKRSRHRTSNKDVPKCGNPNVLRASKEDRQQYAEFQLAIAS